MKTLFVACLLWSQTAFSLSCFTSDPYYEMDLNDDSHWMEVTDSLGRVYSGVASYSDSREDPMMYSYYLPLDFGAGFKFVVSEGFLPNWKLCTGTRECYPCLEPK